MKRLLVLLISVLILLSGCVKGEKHMAVEFDETLEQGITFGALSGLPALQFSNEISVVAFVRVDSSPGHTLDSIYVLFDASAPLTDTRHGFFITADDAFSWFIGFDTTVGQWRSDNGDVNVAGTETVLGVSHDATNVANDPDLYVDGAPVNVTELSTPAGAVSTGTNSIMYLGAPDSPTNDSWPIDGVDFLVVFFDRILTAEEHASIAEQRSVDGYDPVFVVRGDGLENGTVVEEINGYTGTTNAAADPVPYEDDYLHIR